MIRHPRDFMVAYAVPAASVWFEVWGVVNPVAEIFYSNQKKLPIFRKNFPFPGQKFLRPFFSPQLKTNCRFSPNIPKFSPFPSIFLANLSLFLIEKTLSSVLSAQNTLVFSH